MSRLNTMYPDDEFLKNISDMMGKLDNKNETEIKQEIEQIGYKEFYRYYKEKDVYIKQLQQENKILKENAENNDKVVDKVNWENMLLKKENQELKSQLKGTTHCFDEEEHEKLKKQLEELKEEKQEWINLLDMFKNQQKEFIKWLEDYLKLFDNMDIEEQISYDMIEEILQKYKEIIGDGK